MLSSFEKEYCLLYIYKEEETKYNNLMKRKLKMFEKKLEAQVSLYRSPDINRSS
jgi:hypothetical protein